MGHENILATDDIIFDPFNGLVLTNTGIDSTVRDVTLPDNRWLGYVLHENGAAVAWVQVFFKPAAEVTLGTTPPDFTIKLAASDSVAIDFRRPMNVKTRGRTGMSVAGTTLETNATTVATAAITGGFWVY